MTDNGGALHHVELWVPDLERAAASWGWLLAELGYRRYQDWPDGRSWRLGPTYIVIEQSPALTAGAHDRCRPGLNHLAFHVATRGRVDELTEAAPAHGWTLMFPGRHPHAGGQDHYAAYLENADGYEVELVAASLWRLRGNARPNSSAPPTHPPASWVSMPVSVSMSPRSIASAYRRTRSLGPVRGDIQRGIGGDGVQPGAHLRPSFEAVDALPGADQRLPQRVLRVLHGAEHGGPCPRWRGSHS